MSEDKILDLPKHVNPTQTDRTASAPYNFIPLPEVVIKAVDDAEKLPDHDTYANPDYPHAGYFEVTLTTKSPLYVRCPFTLSEFLRQDRNADRGSPFRSQVKNTPDFFYTRDPNRPVIPGSSLRGMLRNILEIVSYGKLDRVTKKKLVYRAVGDSTSLGNWYREQTLGPNQTSYPNMKFDYPSSGLKGGYLCRHNGEWAIRPARQPPGAPTESFVHVDYADVEPIIGGRNRQLVHEVFVQPATRISFNRGPRGPGNLTLNLAVTKSVVARTYGASAPAGMVPAFLVESGHMGRPMGLTPLPHQKHTHCAIYEPDLTAAPIPIPQEMWEAYVEDRDMTRGPQMQPRKLSADGDPLFYLVDASNKLIFFGPTMMFRLRYQRSIHDLIPRPLRDPLTIDYADAIFGFVREKKDFPSGQPIPLQGTKARSYTARVSITDASLPYEVAPEDLWLTGDAAQSIIPKILSSPKPTSFQHYLVQPQTEHPRDLSHYDSPKTDATGNVRGHETVIRGYKRYWHQGGLSLEQIRERIEEERNIRQQLSDHDTQHTQFKPLNPGVSFTFNVYFENLSDKELGALCWTLHPLGDGEKTYCHSLGMGKPLGMGVVKLDATLHLPKRANRYGTLLDGDNWQTGAASAGEKLSDPGVVEHLTQTFEKRILDVLKPNKPCAHLSDLKRIGMLLKMLEWPGLSQSDVATLTLPEFQQRKVLPDPSAPLFGGLTGDAVPTVANETSSNPTSFKNTSNAPQEKKPPPGGKTGGTPKTAVPKSGELVRCILLEEKTKKGGWKAKLKAAAGVGAVLAGNEPLEIAPGQEVDLVVHSNDLKNMSFRWPQKTK